MSRDDATRPTQLLTGAIGDVIDQRDRRNKAVSGGRRFGGGGGGQYPSGSAPADATKIQIDTSKAAAQPPYGALSGAVNAVNAVFTTSQPYVSGRLLVFVHGNLALPGTTNPDRWSETSPAAGTFTFGVAPQIGTEITAWYEVAT